MAKRKFRRSYAAGNIQLGSTSPMAAATTEYKTEKRRQKRKRTRLRSGKLVTLDGHFLTECQFQNIARGGAKIRLVGPCVVPKRFWLFDDQYCGALITEVVWHREPEFGVRFVQDPNVAPLDEAVLHALAGKYYSL